MQEILAFFASIAITVYSFWVFHRYFYFQRVPLLLNLPINFCCSSVFFLSAVLTLGVGELIGLVLLIPLMAAVLAMHHHLRKDGRKQLPATRIRSPQRVTHQAEALVEITKSPPVASPQDLGTQNIKPVTISAPNAPEIISDELIDIKFDYIDQNGHCTRRRVNVEAIDRQHVEGYCHTRKATRTFTRARIRGKITITATGKLTNVRSWAAQVMKHPDIRAWVHNRPVKTFARPSSKHKRETTETQKTLNENLSFLYQNSEGEQSQRELTDWQETGHYISGFCLTENAIRTFRKDRVIQYLNNCNQHLQDPHPTNPPPPARPRNPNATLRANAGCPQIAFTGFKSARRAELEQAAIDSGFDMRKTVTNKLTYLCCGTTAGPSKISKAMAQGTYIIDEAEFLALVETGELPDCFFGDIQETTQ